MAEDKGRADAGEDRVKKRTYADEQVRRNESGARHKAEIEAILFSSGDSVALQLIADAVGLALEETETLLEEMKQSYESEERGIRLLKLDGRVQLCTKKELYPVLIRLEKHPQRPTLTPALMETLSIVAYKQPVTKAEIEHIRGVSCDHAVSRLMEYDLIEEVGRMDAPGRPILLGTTEEFLRHFGAESVSDLPSVSPDRIKDIKAEAEKEAGERLDVEV